VAAPAALRAYRYGDAAAAPTAPPPADRPLAAGEPGAPFRSAWDRAPDRVWLGAEYWANPLQDWRIAGGRIECARAAADRNVHVLTRQLANRSGTLDLHTGAPTDTDSAYV
jgi:hypothetical protein